jgi:uncharacterized protein
LIHHGDHISDVLSAVVEWVKARKEIRGVAFVGSHARNEAHDGSDLDLVLLTEDPNYFRDDAWLTAIDWPGTGARPTKWVDEEYGVVWCRRIWLDPEFEIEAGFAPLSWADVSHVDKGTERVVSDGFRILYDPDELLSRLASAVARL